ncbi:hypothetical protein CHS0354_009688 [Potamilus streckersoni]|uniref:Uncharacterized protein n=1 Tax=Potamilus streckersoni TaxID=2493646 RepID=A0AAE0SXV2_9BIVA|nr:hypothetical protein CHS0354_009688 [Potamilus streckersoni]
MATRHNIRHLPVLQCPVGINPNEKTARHVLQILCTKQRTLFLKEIHQELQKLSYTGNSEYQFLAMMNESQLNGILTSYPDNFALVENSPYQIMVKPQIKLELCKIHCSKNGNCVGRPNTLCNGLHVCKFYILGSCKQKVKNCKYGHNLSTQHNVQVLQDHLLDHLKEEELKYLLNLAVNRPKTTVPQICKFYNVEKGCSNQKEGKPCPYLHLCKHYIIGECRHKGNCKRNHDVFVRDVKLLLERYKIDTARTEKEIIAELRAVLVRDEDDCKDETDEASDRKSKTTTSLASKRVTSAPNLDRQLSFDSSQETNICLYNLRGQCWFKELCRNVHKSMPYQWQTRHQSDCEWVDLDEQDNLNVESKFSNPACDEFIYVDSKRQKVHIVFDTMEGVTGDRKSLKIQRLSTVSFEAENQPLATKWHWFWQDELGKWIEYGSKNIMGHQTTIASSQIEQKYLENSKGDFKISTPAEEYCLDFNSMIQQNLRTRNKRKVRRRSEYVTPQEAEEAKKKKQQVVQSAKGTVMGLQCPVPETWSVQSGQDVIDIFKQVEVKKTSDTVEYQKVETLFLETLRKEEVSITSIQRIENGELWTNYYMKMLKMKRKKPDITELYLFHGTHSKYIEAICHQGFDFRLSGMATGTLYGKGSYFAKTSKYSDSYTELGNRVMFLVKVLAGDYTTGDRNYRRPPLKDPDNPHGDLYDSCVDNVKNPNIFVIFDNCQVYPEYIIKYSKNSTLV